MKTLLLIIGIFALSIVGGNVWWALWMNYGWPGSPGIPPVVLKADGESAYDATTTEMMILAGLALCGVWFLLRKPRTKV